MVIAAVKNAVKSLFQAGYPYAKAGVGLIDIVPNSHQQLNFFNVYQSQQSEVLMGVIDTIKNKSLGHIGYGSSGVDPSWVMRRMKKSPNYTGSINELVRVTV